MKTDTNETKIVRGLRVGEQVRHALSDILARGDVHDPVLEKHMVTITEVRMSPDLRHATAFVKPLLGKDEAIVLKALRTNTAFLQRECAQRVQARFAAKLKFIADESFDEGTHIEQLLKQPEIARDLTSDEG
ncbi:MAG: 30S ribosome-binding factor RbfA [Sphingomonas sp.]|nr:MAG: 30S ribosome-binding factor RbfA [Sphingomonas sp.]